MTQDDIKLRMELVELGIGAFVRANRFLLAE